MPGVLGRVALVSGCGSAEGIGFATARALLQGGASVVVTSTTSRIHERAKQLGPRCLAVIADLTNPADVASLIAEARKRFGRIDILVNNAGMLQQGRKHRHAAVEKIRDDDWQRDLALNVTTAFNMTRAVLPFMLRRGFGRIVNVASVTGPLVAIETSGGYAAGKAAMIGLTRTTAIENAARGITCNAVLPGWIATASSSPKEIRAGKATPARRPGTAAEVAACCLFLASDEASYVNGTTLVVDGANSIVEMKALS